MRDPAPQLLMVGLCHNRASLAELGRVAVRRENLPHVLTELVGLGFSEAAVLSTCSRTEIYATATTDQREAAARGLDSISAWSGLSRPQVEAAAHALTGPDAVAHLFRVTAGLESRLVGDVDVVAQVGMAWRAARDAGTAGPLLDRLFPSAIRGARRVHADTALGRQGRSLAKRAVDVGLATATRSSELEVLVVGSGQMATIACDHLTAGGHTFRVAARDQAYAARLAGAEQVCPLNALVEGVRRADLLLCATSAAHHVLMLEHVTEAIAGRRRPLTVVDLAVPPNVDAGVGELTGVRLVDLTALGDEARRDPDVAGAVLEARHIVDRAARRLCDDLAARDAGPVINALRASVAQTCLEELRRHGGEADPDALVRMAHAVAGKVLHRPTMLARAAAASGDR
ncbi:MAG TPA: glutamyl-tRNA reductase, partial [Marmoricola sp.]|nr:glutamyl-tRNA reductase [Marmoricola sp.]